MGNRGYHDEETLKRLYYDEGLTQKEIANKYGVTHQTISDWMNKLGINPGIEAGQFEDTGKANFFTVKTGYEVVAAWNKDKKQMEHVKLHRLLACLEFGFDKISDNHVHHRNGVKWDNRPENLKVLPPSEHIRNHAKKRENTHLMSPGESREHALKAERDEKGQFISKD